MRAAIRACQSSTHLRWLSEALERLDAPRAPTTGSVDLAVAALGAFLGTDETRPTQVEGLAHALDGDDVLVIAATGTGKTAVRVAKL